MEFERQSQNRARFSPWIIFVIVSFCLNAPAWGQKNNNRKNDERRENERVKNAQEKLQSTQKQLADAVKDSKGAMQAVSAAEKVVLVSRDHVRDEKESAESRLDAKSGIPELIEELKKGRTAFAKLADPIRAKVHATEEWLKADDEANDAKARKSELLEEVKDLKEREAELKLLEPIIAKPMELEWKAIRSDKEALAASDNVDRLKLRLDDLRRKFPNSKIEEDPLVKKAKASLEQSEKKWKTALKEAQSAKARVAKLNASVADAQQQLAKAKEADRKNK